MEMERRRCMWLGVFFLRVGSRCFFFFALCFMPEYDVDGG